MSYVELQDTVVSSLSEIAKALTRMADILEAKEPKRQDFRDTELPVVFPIPESKVGEVLAGDDPDFYTFDEALRALNIDENRLKRLVSEGELRAFRKGDEMKFKRKEIDGIMRTR